MIVSPEALSLERCYYLMSSCIVPRPIAWVGTLNEDESYNLAPYSYFNAVSATPPIVGIGIGRAHGKPEKDTLRNARRTGELTVSIPTLDQASLVESSGENLPYGDDEFKQCGLTPRLGQVVSAPIVAEAKVSLECTVYDIIPIKRSNSTLLLAEIKIFHIRDTILDDKQCADPKQFNPLVRMGSGQYASIDEVFTIKDS
jgi:flavin reductase (DIM6/NTAB) family NADH-FMN oxidoreductase RutF